MTPGEVYSAVKIVTLLAKKKQVHIAGSINKYTEPEFHKRDTQSCADFDRFVPIILKMYNNSKK